MKKASQLGGFSVFLRMLSLYGKTPPNQGKVKKNAKKNGLRLMAFQNVCKSGFKVTAGFSLCQ